MAIKRTAILSGGIAAILSLVAAAGALANQGTADTGQSLAPSGSSGSAAGYPSPGSRGWDGEFDSNLVSYIEPGDRVDLIATVNAAVKSDGTAGTIMSKVLVVGVRPSERAGKSVLRFHIGPLEAQYLELFSHLGGLRPALRKKGDKTHPAHPRSSWETILQAVRAINPYHPEEAQEERAGPPAVPRADRPALLASIHDSMEGAPYLALSILTAGESAAPLRAGDRVDILATLDLKEFGRKKAQKTTLTISQHIKVLAAGKSELHPGQDVVLLELSWIEAQNLALALDTAEVRLLLRPEGDRDIYAINPVSLESAWPSPPKK